MQIDPKEVSPSEIYRTMTQAITPRPIAWVSTVSPAGVPNLAPFSYFNGVCSDPPILSFSVVNKSDGSSKDTLRNIKANKQFVVNVVPFRLAKPMVKTATELPYEENEIDLVGLETLDSVKVAPPRIADSPIHFECRLHQIVRVGEGPLAANLILGQIKLIHVAPSILDEHDRIDPHRVDCIGRLGGQDYCRTTERFSVLRQ